MCAGLTRWPLTRLDRRNAARLLGWKDAGLSRRLAWPQGCVVGRTEGCSDGVDDGWPVGRVEGCMVGRITGTDDALLVGCELGWTLGCLDGCDEGCIVGLTLG